MTLGHVLAIVGAVFAVLGGGIGSSIGVSRAGRAAAGAMTENPSLFTKVILLTALPGSQGIYGLAIGAIVIFKIGILGGSLIELSTLQGWIILAGCMPMAFGGLLSAIQQAKVAASSIVMLTKQPEQSGKAILMVALVELYALFSLAVSFLIVFFAA